MNRGAIFTGDGKFRLFLIRHWDLQKPILTAIMLNPSRANAHRDDPTTTFMINIAKREGCGRYLAVNLHDYVDTDPNGMKNIIAPVSPDNDKYIIEAVRGADKIIVAWGTHGNFMGRADHVMQIFDNGKYGLVEFMCFGTNNDGSPKFPRALRKDVGLVPYHHRVD